MMLYTAPRHIPVTGVSNSLIEVLPSMSPVFSFEFLDDTNTRGDRNTLTQWTIVQLEIYNLWERWSIHKCEQQLFCIISFDNSSSLKQWSEVLYIYYIIHIIYWVCDFDTKKRYSDLPKIMSRVFAVTVIGYRALLILSPSLGDGELLISWPSVGDGELLPSSSESFLSAARLPIIVVVVVVVRKVPEEVWLDWQ